MLRKLLERLDGSVTPHALLHTAAGVLFCLGVLLLDMSTNSDIVEAFLLPLAFIAVYPVRRDWSTALITVTALATVIAGAMLEDDGESLQAMVVHRAMAVAVIVGVAFLLNRVAASERELFRIATTDALTGISNRRHFLTLLGREQDRALRYGTTFSLLMLDIDHFKRINDGYGHPVGDAAIKALAEAASAHLRPTDVIGRYGGEEFCVLLTQTNEAGAGIAAERIRAAVEQIILLANGGIVRFTVSIGTATFTRRAGLDQLVECADQALYAAKAGGRNRVCAGRMVDTASAPARLATA